MDWDQYVSHYGATNTACCPASCVDEQLSRPFCRGEQGGAKVAHRGAGPFLGQPGRSFLVATYASARRLKPTNLRVIAVQAGSRSPRWEANSSSRAVLTTSALSLVVWAQAPL